MTKDDFDQLRNLPNKIIQNDLEFVQSANPSVFRCEQKIDNNLGYEVILTGTYNELLPSVIFNFRVVGIGAICRYCVNGKLHKDAVTKKLSRTHKHSLKTENCPNNNIPNARERLDLDIKTFSDIEGIWSKICNEAKIQHLGKVTMR